MNHACMCEFDTWLATSGPSMLDILKAINFKHLVNYHPVRLITANKNIIASSICKILRGDVLQDNGVFPVELPGM